MSKRPSIKRKSVGEYVVKLPENAKHGDTFKVTNVDGKTKIKKVNHQ